MDKSFVTETPDELAYIAESDLIAVKELFAGTYYPPDRMHNIICFHAAQAVEKFIKGYIISKGKNIEKTHDLDYLQKITVNIDASFVKIKNNCVLLNTFLHNIKYSSRKPITKQDINKIIKSLEIISNFLPIKEMRISFAKKHKYEIVTGITTGTAKPNNDRKKTSPDYVRLTDGSNC
jgi:HEPN domain-containing protein